MKRALEMIAAALEGLEGIILAGFLATVGPFIWLYWLVRAHHIGLAGTVALIWLASVGIIGFEVRRKAITAISLFVVLMWLVVLVFVFVDHLA